MTAVRFLSANGSEAIAAHSRCGVKMRLRQKSDSLVVYSACVCAELMPLIAPRRESDGSRERGLTNEEEGVRFSQESDLHVTPAYRHCLHEEITGQQLIATPSFKGLKRNCKYLRFLLFSGPVFLT